MAFDFTKDKKSPHDIFAYHLLVPRGANSSTQRIQMLSQHTAQMMTLANPEFPKVFTNFENLLGQASITGYKKAQQDFIVRNIIKKDKYNYTMIIQYKYSKQYDIINFKCYDHIGALSESYGTKMLAGEALKNAKVGSEIAAGTYLYYTPMYDEDDSFKYGTNLRAIYTPWEGLNHEDAIVLTESAAEKLTSYQVEEIEVKIGGNQVFLDLYNKTRDENTYHSFPHVGEYTNGQILVALRQKTNNRLLYEFQQEKMRQIETTDRIIHCPENSEVVEIDVYTTKTPEELRNTNDMFMREIADVLEDQNRYWEELKSALDEIIPVANDEQVTMFMSETEKKMYRYELETFKTNIDRALPHEQNPNSYTNDVGYYWKLAHEYCNRKIKWRTDGNVLDNIIIKFTLLKTDKVDIGLKLSGRSKF